MEPRVEKQMRRKNFYLSIDLADRAERLAAAGGSNLSELIREALEAYIAKMEQEKVEKEMREACVLYFESDKELAGAWGSTEPGIE